MSDISHLREVSRKLVREFGFLRSTVAGTDLSPSAAHAMIEIGATDGMTAGQLCDLLILEKSSVSRMLRKLVEAGEVRETPAPGDGRTKLLSLTVKGRATLAAIDDYSRHQVAGALRHLSPDEISTVTNGIGLYAEALSRGRRREAVVAPARGPADLADAAMLFRAYADSLEIDLGYQSFAEELASLPGKYAPPAGDLFLARREDGLAVGCAAFRPQDPAGVCEMKRLYVTPEGRGQGLGRRLAEAVITSARRAGYDEIRLDTLPSMQAAISLYRSCGFEPMEAYYDTPIAGTVFMRCRLS